jgi:hypothetical protein
MEIQSHAQSRLVRYLRKSVRKPTDMFHELPLSADSSSTHQEITSC